MVEIAEVEKRWLESNKIISLLVLLEYQYPDILSKISNTKISRDDATDLIIYALDFESRHWAEKAIIWLESGFPMSDKIYQRLLSIPGSKTDSQNIRHRATKLVNKWQRAKNT